jgi:pentatricopeptide repeat protein
MSNRDQIDHGEIFVPHAKASNRNLAPQEIDHYKRGYSERANLRQRDTEKLSSRGQHAAPNHHNNQRPNANLNLNHFVDRICDGNGNGNGPGRQRVNIFEELDQLMNDQPWTFKSGKSVTTILSLLARRRNMNAAMEVWRWMDHAKIERSVFHYNSLISVCEKGRDWRMALDILRQMDDAGIKRNEITFSSAISACEKSGNHQIAIDLLDQMEKECEAKSVIPYNAAISACEKGLASNRALQIFDRMKKRGVEPTVITYSALISALEKCGQWQLALDVLEDMKKDFGMNVIAYSAAIAALSKGQQWAMALNLFRELQATGASPSVVTYNTTMTALEKGLQVRP